MDEEEEKTLLRLETVCSLEFLTKLLFHAYRCCCQTKRPKYATKFIAIQLRNRDVFNK